jgi:hypothetical protein
MPTRLSRILRSGAVGVGAGGFVIARQAEDPHAHDGPQLGNLLTLAFRGWATRVLPGGTLIDTTRVVPVAGAG